VSLSDKPECGLIDQQLIFTGDQAQGSAFPAKIKTLDQPQTSNHPEFIAFVDEMSPIQG